MARSTREKLTKRQRIIVSVQIENAAHSVDALGHKDLAAQLRSIADDVYEGRADWQDQS
jgi:hypothetical protein